MSKVVRPARVTPPTVGEDRKIRAAARADPEAQPLSAKQLKTMVPLRALRGRPKSATPKLLVSVRYSAEVLRYFKSTGAGWQSRMDEVLRAYVNRRSRAR